ncbi:hypothetical protein [uncultured Desulfobacter sp.]|uniref:hypothetical protein n=1 Tax=uncultured Desulfobacter sp. TaxID=240139 RepID=UPI0029C9725F|nr:hypothetical protein [uncultured Desulfobacter sp.]
MHVKHKGVEIMQTQSETLVRKQFFISPAQVKKLEKLSSTLKGRSAAQIVRDAIDAYDPAGDLAQSQEQELLAIAHAKVKEAITRTEDTIRKVDHCLENLSAAKGVK